MNQTSNTHTEQPSLITLFLVFLRLGLTSFGGPVAHLGYFREEFVAQKKWLDERSYGDIVALCQFMPGPASSQVGMAIGFSRGGHLGALLAWAGFTLPSAVALILFASGIAHYGENVAPGVLHGLKVVAVAVVAQAVWGMARSHCPDATRINVMMVATCITLLTASIWTQVALIIGAAMIGVLIFKPEGASRDQAPPGQRNIKVAVLWLGVFVTLLVGLPILAWLFPNQTLLLVDAFYRSGSLVFGGGHVVLPLLQAEVVPTGWVDQDTFLAGYGAAQAVPGPLFTFAAFLGTSMQVGPSGWTGGMIALLAIFAPSFFLVTGVLPFWERLRRSTHIQAALLGINSAVVGLLLAALYQPVWTSAIDRPEDFALAGLALVALMVWRLPPWLVVILGGGIGWGLDGF